jgi:hypothetical protein
MRVGRSLILAGAAVVGLAVGVVPGATADSTTTPTTDTTTTPTTPTTSTPTTPAPTPTIPRGSLKLYFKGAYSLGSSVVTVPGHAVEVQGYEHPYVKRQWVTVKAYLGKKLIHSGPLRLSPIRHARYGRFIVHINPSGAGRVTIIVKHASTKALRGFGAHAGLDALDPNASFGSTGPFVQLIQQRLSALHFFIPMTGVYDAGTGLALDAYHRLLRWGTYQTLDSRTVDALLAGQGQFPVRYPGDGKHAEGNLTLQLLALSNGSHVYWILPISSGKPSTPTILGRFHVYSRVPSYLPDGMYYSDFFYTGYAIHGYNPDPDYPASHGCMRLPIVDAIPVYNWLALGDAVDTYF